MITKHKNKAKKPHREVSDSTLRRRFNERFHGLGHVLACVLGNKFLTTHSWRELCIFMLETYDDLYEIQKEFDNYKSPEHVTQKCEDIMAHTWEWLSVWDGGQFNTPMKYVQFVAAVKEYYDEFNSHLVKQYMGWWNSQEKIKPVADGVDDDEQWVNNSNNDDEALEGMGDLELDSNEQYADSSTIPHNNGLRTSNSKTMVTMSIDDLKNLIAEEARRSFFTGASFMETQDGFNDGNINEAVDNYGENRRKNYEFKPFHGMTVTYN
jgi:hypothetical protein